MISAGDNDDVFIIDRVDKSVFACDPSGPETAQLMSQRLRFSQAVKRVSSDIFDQLIDSLESLFVVVLPVEVIVPGILAKDELHLF